jgi:hypothetical protein
MAAGGITDPEPESFTVAILPDTQFHSLRYPDFYKAQTKWLVDKRDSLNLKIVLHMGDITDGNTSKEWARASAAHKLLDNAGIPYSVTTGNHDYPKVDDEVRRRRRDAGRFNQHFPPSRFSPSWYGGHFGAGNENNYALFEGAKRPYIALNLEYAPTKDAMCWAGNVLRQHADRRAIVTTHCYSDEDGKLLGNCGIRDQMIGATAHDLWAELISNHQNIFLVLSGHITDSEHLMRDRDTGKEVTSTSRDTVHEILTDYQNERNGLLKSGNGWLRTLEFRPKENRVYVRVHSAIKFPKFDASGYNGPYDADPEHSDHTFSFGYDMTGAKPPQGGAEPKLTRFADRTVNSDDHRDQRTPRIGMSSSGDWVAVWQDDSHGAEGVYQIYARGFDAAGCQRFSDRTINVVETGQQLNPALAMAPDGRFVVVWEDDGGDGKYQIKARGFKANGQQLFPQRTINATASGQQRRPAVAIDPNGNFVVVWEDDANNNGVAQIKARGFDATGTVRIGQFTVNTAADGQQLRPAIAMNQSGDFVIAWQDDGNENDIYQIKARGFTATGSQRFAQRTINTQSEGQQLRPAVGMDANGGFIVAWEDDANENEVFQIKARGFNSAGSPQLSEFTVNTRAAGQQRRPSIAVDDGGQIVVAWQDDANENGEYQIKARGFKSSGEPLMDQQTINRNSRGQQVLPSVALHGSGRFVVVWQDDLEKNNSWEILARGCSVLDGC